MNPGKPLFRMSAKTFTFIFLAVGIILTTLGVYFAFFQSRGYGRTTGVITDLRLDPGADTVSFIPTVTFTVDGIEYRAELDTNVRHSQLGKEINITYDPERPTRIHEDSPVRNAALIAVGVLVFAAATFSLVKNKRQLAQLEQQGERPLFGASMPGGEERKLYFLTDLGTAKGTCHIEDAERRVLYEALCPGFSLFADSRYEFVDRELNRRTTHFIGKTVTSSSGAPWAIDSHSTFTVDGKDVWDVLHENGVRIRTGLDGIRWAYTVYRNDAVIAQVTGANKLVHEEDAEAKGAIAQIPFPGFFRITTCEENLDVIFLVLFAIGRTDMRLYD